MNVKNKKRKLILYYAANTIIALLFVLPLIWMVSASFKPERFIFSEMTSWRTFIPFNFTIQNYIEVFNRTSMWKYIMNSVVYVGIMVFFDLVVNSMCGFALAKFNFRGKNLVAFFVISFMAVPIECIIIPLYIQVGSYGWLDSMKALIIPFVINCFSIYMFESFFKDIPDDLLEAAAMDGCSPVRTYWRIVVPISKPIFCTVLILDFVEHWNDFMWPLLATTSENARTIQLGVQMFFGTKPIQYGPIMAALTISAIPMIIMFLIFQKYYIQGIASTGIKE